MTQKQVVITSITLLIFAAGFIMAFNMSGSHEPTATSTPTSSESLLSEDDNKNLAPDFSLTTIEGKAVTMSDFKGKGIILNFWATWCPPCRAEIPDMIELQTEYEKKNFTFIGVAVGDKAENVKAYAKKEGINYPLAMGTPEITRDYGQFIDGGIRGIPTSFIINAKGEVLGHFVGARSKEIFEEAILQSLKK